MQMGTQVALFKENATQDGNECPQ